MVFYHVNGDDLYVVFSEGDYGSVKATLLMGCDLVSETEYCSFEAARKNFPPEHWVEK